MSLLHYESLFSALNLHTARGLASPHKVAIRLAVTDPIESENEVEHSRESKDQYSLYRVYEFRSRGRRLFRMPGRIDDHVRLNPVLYPAGFG